MDIIPVLWWNSKSHVTRSQRVLLSTSCMICNLTYVLTSKQHMLAALAWWAISAMAPKNFSMRQCVLQYLLVPWVTWVLGHPRPKISNAHSAVSTLILPFFATFALNFFQRSTSTFTAKSNAKKKTDKISTYEGPSQGLKIREGTQ